MYLKALKLQGFKSFADPTLLRFEPGVTAIVGPNGCGKSNLADAIRWVLGEQSAKALRGGKMQDVIFEGADTRRPAQLCEVTLQLTECEKQLGSEFHEIEITRRVHRDGVGEYAFNGQPCRLKDIQKLFMDTGIGRTSYSIMAQGQIDQILSSKPEERRAVFEEAAGITKYKSQRREALGKLALTEQNLARVADVVAELSRQLGSLRRQAAKAVRHQRLHWRLRHLVLGWQGCQFARLSEVLAGLEAQVLRLRAAAETRRTHLQQQQSALEERRQRRAQLQKNVQQAQHALLALTTAREQAEKAAQVAQIKRSGLAERLAATREDLGTWENQLQDLRQQQETGVQDKQLQLDLLGGSDAVFKDRHREVALLDQELAEREEILSQTKFQALQAESHVARLRTECSSFEVDQRTGAHRREALAEDQASLARQLAEVEARLSELTAQVEEAQVARARTQQATVETQARLTALAAQAKTEQHALQEQDRQLTQRAARLRVLQQLQDKGEGLADGAKALLQGRLVPAYPATTGTPVSRGLAVPTALAPAFAALLGPAAEALAVSDPAAARAILQRLHDDKLGGALLWAPPAAPAPLPSPALPTHTPASAHPPASAPPPGLRPALELLSAPPPPGHPALSLLRDCYITESEDFKDLTAFTTWWVQHPQFHFNTLATPRGDWLTRHGLHSAGQAQKSGQSLVQRESEIREIALGLADDEARLTARQDQLAALAQEQAEATASLETDREEVLRTSSALAEVQAEERGLTRQQAELAQRAARLTRDQENLEQQSEETQARFERARANLAEALTTGEAARSRIGKLEQELAGLRTERDLRRDTLATARLEVADRRQKVDVLDKGIAELERRRRQLQELIVQRQRELETWAAQIDQLAEEQAQQQARADELTATLAAGNAELAQHHAALSELEQLIGGVESSQQDLRTQAETAQAELGRCEIQLAEHTARASFLAEEVKRDYQIRVGQYDWRALLWRSEDDPPDLPRLDLDEDDEAPETPPPTTATPPDDATTPGLNASPTNASPASSSSAAPATTDSSASTASPTRRRRKPVARPEPTEADLAELAAQVDLAALHAEIEVLRQRVAGLGAVNTGAIAEYLELRERHDFLRAQSDDLAKAKAELVRVIDEINATSLQQFEITFAQIKKNFIYTFQTLFGGGVANLELVAGEDVLESGIEITAQPPGTKLKSITLLSGGQKTLTAVGLLFALYLVKPSPFCLLDELDAPLDESNIGRFTDLLRKFVHSSQFIIITHNKRTVSAAQAIYGVTMEERGVSKTVSMRFNPAHGDLETHPTNLAESVRAARPA